MFGSIGGLGGSMVGTGFGAVAPMMTSQRTVDVHVPHVVQRAIPRVETQIIDRQVPRVEIQTVERVVEVPQVRRHFSAPLRISVPDATFC